MPPRSAPTTPPRWAWCTSSSRDGINPGGRPCSAASPTGRAACSGACRAARSGSTTAQRCCIRAAQARRCWGWRCCGDYVTWRRIRLLWHNCALDWKMTMSAKTLYDKLWDTHVVRQEADGTALIYIDRQLVHEVTSPQAFEGLKLAHRKPWRTASMLAVPDHNVPTTNRASGITDPISRLQVETLDANCAEFGVTEFKMNDIRQGIVHVIGPEQGATLPGMTVVCGDSHTSTHGAC